MSEVMTMADQDVRPVRPDAPTSEAPAAGAPAGGAGPDARGPAVAQAAADRSPRVAELEQQVAELEDRWRRALAEADNLRKRFARESELQRARERAEVAAAWLPVVDNLELALAHAAGDPRAIVEGVRAVRDQALAVLVGLGFPRRDDVGAAFDPALHEAVAAEAAPDVRPGTVVRVVRPAYGDEGRQLRPAAVVVAAAPTTPDGGDGDSRREAGAQ
jgi:molecular chaperone GrpE